MRITPPLSFRPRERTQRVTEWRNLARKRIGYKLFLPCSERLTVLCKIPPLGRFYRAPKKYRRTFWEEERQALRARRQTKCAVCHGALVRRGRDDMKERSFGSPFTGLPKSIEELFGKRSGKCFGRGGKRSAPPALAPCRDELRMTGRESP